jgi:pyridoxine kinase
VAAANGTISNVLFDKGTREVFVAEVPRQDRVPNGTGDLLSALYLGHGLRGVTPSRGLALAVAGVGAVIHASTGQDELALVASSPAWADPQPWPLRTL